MALTFTYPSNRTLEGIMADLLPLSIDEAKLLKLMPFQYKPAALIEWEQPDNGYGLMSLRGIGGAPTIIQQPGFKKFRMAPGYYGTQINLDEQQLTEGRDLGDIEAKPIDITDLTQSRFQMMMAQGIDRAEQTISALLRRGQFLNVSDDGRISHGDQISNFNRLTPGTAWTTKATSTPIADLRGWKATLQRGTSSRFGAESTLLMNSNTLNDILANTNTSDLGGIKLKFGSTPLGLPGLNEILKAQDLPQIEVYDRGYFSTVTAAQTASNSNYFLPNQEIIWQGTRPQGQTIGRFVLTYNIHTQSPEGGNPDLNDNQNFGGGDYVKGFYTRIIDPQHVIPRQVQLHHGFNGGPAIYYPSAVASIYY